MHHSSTSSGQLQGQEQQDQRQTRSSTDQDIVKCMLVLLPEHQEKLESKESRVRVWIFRAIITLVFLLVQDVFDLPSMFIATVFIIVSRVVTAMILSLTQNNHLMIIYF